MEKLCFNCDGPASARYTLVLDSGDMVEDKPLCDRCFSFFDGAYTIEVVEAPVLMRGGDEEDEEE